MSLQWFFERFDQFDSREAIVIANRSLTYEGLKTAIQKWEEKLPQVGIKPGEVVAVLGDHSPDACALFLALLKCRTVVVLLSPHQQQNRSELFDIANVQHIISLEMSSPTFTETNCTVSHFMLQSLIDQARPGVIFFTSGSTGKSKGILHDADKLFEKFRRLLQPVRLISFLTLDHMGGLNTMLHILSNGGTMIVVPDRRPETICQAIEKYRVELLPTTPSFLNLLILSEAYKKFDMSSLVKISYGTEMMPDSTLKKLNQLFPKIELQQTYGLSELGVLRTKSKNSHSKWVRIGGEGVETKVQDGTLRIRTFSAMIGYLNAPQPFDGEGWYNTEDVVEVDGEFLRFLGRKSEVINVAGQKVFPAEIEDVLMQMQEVEEVLVLGEKNDIFGTIVTATVKPCFSVTASEFRKSMRLFCKGKLADYKIPVKIYLTDVTQLNHRYKKIRQVKKKISLNWKGVKPYVEN